MAVKKTIMETTTNSTNLSSSTDQLHFKYLFWFCSGVFVLSFSAMLAILWVPMPAASREMASNSQGFIQGSLLMSVIGFVLGGTMQAAANKKITSAPGTTTVELSASTTPVIAPVDDIQKQ